MLAACLLQNGERILRFCFKTFHILPCLHHFSAMSLPPDSLTLFHEQDVPGMLVAVIGADGRVESFPQRPFLEGGEPERLCWSQEHHDRLKMAIMDACMRREVVQDLLVSFRIGDRCEAFVLTLRPLNDRGAVCYFFTDRRHELTLAEQQVLHLVITGHDNAAISDKLEIKRTTVARHLKNMGERLNVQRLEQLVAAALGYKFHPPEK